MNTERATQTAGEEGKPRVALVLGGGGLKPLSAIPLLRFLDANGIRPSLLVGCSGGAGTLAMWASGYSHEEMAAFFRDKLRPSLFLRDWKSVAATFGLCRADFGHAFSFFKTAPIFRLFRGMYGDRRLEALNFPLVLQATDYETGEGVELERGDLVDAVYASSAVYPFFHPIRLDGRLLFDGLYSAPLPVLAAVRRGADVVIAVDFMEKMQPNPKSFYEAMVHVNKVFTKTIVESQMAFSIDMHHHEIIYVKVRFDKYIQLWDVGTYDLILEAGKRAVEEFGPEILAVCADGAVPRTGG